MSKTYSKYLTITMPNGEKKKLKFRGNTEEEAQAKKEEAELKVKLGLLTFNDNTPLRRYAENYFDVFISPRFAEYQADLLWGIFDRIFLAEIGHVPVSEIKKSHLQRCFNKLQGKSKSYISKANFLISGILRSALSDGLIKTNPLDGMKKEKGKDGHHRALTNYEREMFFRALLNHPKGLLFALMMGSGLRPGEARAATWPNVDWESHEYKVTNAVKKTSNCGCKGVVVGEPKNNSSYRSAPIPDFLYNMLLEEYEKPKASLYIVHDERGMPINERSYRRAWDSFRREMQLAGKAKTYRNKIIIFDSNIGNDITPYCLRHTFATICAENKIDLKQAQEWMGHSSLTMLNEVYTHVSEVMKDRSTKIAQKMFNNMAETTVKKSIL